MAAALLALENAYCSAWGCSVMVCGDLVHRMAVCVVIILGIYKGVHTVVWCLGHQCVGQPVVLEIYETWGGVCGMEHFELEIAACHPSWERPFS